MSKKGELLPPLYNQENRGMAVNIEMKHVLYLILALYTKIHKLIWAAIAIYLLFFLKINNFRYSLWALNSAWSISNIIGKAVINYGDNNTLLSIICLLIGIILILATFVGCLFFLFMLPYIIIKSIDMSFLKFSMIKSTDYYNEFVWASEDKENKTRSFRLNGIDTWNIYKESLDQEKTTKESKTNDFKYEDFNFDDNTSKTGSLDNKISELDKAKIFFGLDDETYTLEELKKIRNKLIKQWHTDNGDGNDKTTAKINSYYDLLKKAI